MSTAANDTSQLLLKNPHWHQIQMSLSKLRILQQSFLHHFFKLFRSFFAKCSLVKLLWLSLSHDWVSQPKLCFGLQVAFLTSEVLAKHDQVPHDGLPSVACVCDFGECKRKCHIECFNRRVLVRDAKLLWPPSATLLLPAA